MPRVWRVVHGYFPHDGSLLGLVVCGFLFFICVSQGPESYK